MITFHNIYSDVSKNGLGNRLFQYCWARDLAEKKGYELEAIPILGFPETYKKISGIRIEQNPLVTPPATQIFDINSILNHDGQIIVYGYPQRYEHYISNKENIRKWLYIENEDIYEKPNPNDLVINVRLGDYVPLGWDLPIEYYTKLLKKETYDKAIVICDEPNHPKIKILKNLGCIIQDNMHHNELKFLADFVYVKNAKKCIISNSTFSWWAAFLGTGKIYFPCINFPWINNPSPNDVDLRVYDEKRYIIVINEKSSK